MQHLPDWKKITSFPAGLTTSAGRRLDALVWEHSPTLLVFLRHTGCTFCREMLADLQAAYPKIQAKGIQVILVHMSDANRMRKILHNTPLSEIEQVSDPDCVLYKCFGLRKGSLAQLFGPAVWRRGWEAGVCQRHGVGWLDGDGFQLPGIFGLRNGRVNAAFIHRHAGDRPDYHEISEQLLARNNETVP